MKIAIVAPYCSLPGEPQFNRFWYLAELLSQSHDVLLITSNFKHYDKSFRRHEAAENAAKCHLKIMLLKEPGYQKNVSFARIKSHRVFVRNFEKWLNAQEKGAFDAVYSAYPLMATNILLGKHKARLGYKLIIDVQDVWPEAFSAVLPFVKKMPHRFLPFASRANRAYRAADSLAAVSQTYLARAKEANPNAIGEVVYIGADFSKLNAAVPKTFERKAVRFFYFGTLSFSYDVETACKGIQKMRQNGQNVELHVMGGGPDFDKLKMYESEAVKFYGYLPYADMMSIAKSCNIAVNAIHSYAMQSVTNKLSDYIALQKPILNSQNNLEVLELLTLMPSENYQSGNVESFIQAAEKLLTKQNGNVQAEAIERGFKRDVSYQTLIRLIERTVYE